MMKSVHPKLPMRNLSVTTEFYIDKLGFKQFGGDHADYLMVQRNQIEIHFFLFEALDPNENYGQVYIRTEDIDALFKDISERTEIHPNGGLGNRPWGMREFSILDPDNNLLTFGQSVLS